MKRIITLGLLGLLSISCSRDNDDNESINEGAIVGKWIPIKETFNGKVEIHSHECRNKKDYIQFYTNGTGEVVEYNSNCYQNNIATFSYHIEGNRLYTRSADGVTIIKKLSSNTLILEKNDIDLDGDGRKDISIQEFTK